MSHKVYANGMAIAAKVGGGKVIAAFPDVCMSPPPPPAGPVPIPYPNSSFSKDLKKGSKTVKVGGKPIALKDSFYKTSPLGNEAATKNFGASVLSHQTSGKTQFGAYSFDVKVEGKNVCRHLDFTTSNHGSQPGGTPPMVNVQGIMVQPKVGDGDLNCPHPRLSRSSPDENQAKRQAIDDKISDEKAKSVAKLDAACAAEAAGDFQQMRKLWKQALEAERQSSATAFEKKVNDETNAREVSVDYECPDCLMNGEIDTITDSGVVKECKTGTPKLKQLKKIESVSKILFPGAPVHLAVPKDMYVGTPWTVQRH